MKKKTSLLGLTALLCGLSMLSAQVTIGSDTEPQATLDVVASSTGASTAEGVIAPRLTGDQIKAKDAQYGYLQKGAIVYATSKVTSASAKTANITSEGYYYFNGSVWLGMAVGNTSGLKISKQPGKFQFSRLQDPFGDPNAPLSVNINLTVEVVGGTLPYAYQWKSVNANPYLSDADASGATSTSAAYTFQSSGTGVANWGLFRFYCLVTDAAGDSVKSDIAEIALGTGAKTSDGRWLKFAAYNLGADKILNPMIYTSNGTDGTEAADIKGDLYQWGRVADGHEKRNSLNVAGPVYLPAQDQVPNTGTMSSMPASLGTAAACQFSDFYGKFITASSYEYFLDWRTPQVGWLWYSYGNNGNDPCYIASSGTWQLPAQTDWEVIIGANGFARQSYANATSNTWAWTANGYEVRPDGSTATLFLPAAGYRNYAGTLNNVGTNGYYWSSTASASGAFNLAFYSGMLGPGDANYRARGRSVRCVQRH